MLKLIEYTPAAKQRSFDPYNSAVNVEHAFGNTRTAKSEYAANVLLAAQTRNNAHTQEK